MEDAAPSPPRRHLRAPSRYISCEFDGGSRTARTVDYPERPGQPRCEASSVDDDDNQGIHRHDDAPHMVQLGYNLLYHGTKTVAVCGIGYNLLSSHHGEHPPPHIGKKSRCLVCNRCRRSSMLKNITLVDLVNYHVIELVEHVTVTPY
ncbi:uncharacterized protein [Triticum aestivum]|uniref:uncharacterized protein isoform X1 n=1 Tax=Triticum aestivum TaxID=4565 RepID=UPI001D011BAC|nr:uncharacterized protein LOC123051186 isoform X1 [Triticum aestivum]XP_044445198.1 uncharacterized protein LOC123172264 isoform X1 [Triticum aestivum]